MRKSVVLVEVIFSIVLFSIIIIGSMKMIFSIYKTNNNKTFQTHNNIKLEATRLFLIKNNDNNLTELNINNTDLYFDEDLLLTNVTKYESTQNNNIQTIKICIEDDKICQTWMINTQ